MASTDPRFVEVYRARNLPEAHTIRIALEDAGIPVQLEGDLLQGIAGELPLGWATAPRILVEEAHVTAARELIERANAVPRADPSEDEQDEVIRCLACGQVMVETAKCPSCGWSYQGTEDA